MNKTRATAIKCVHSLLKFTDEERVQFLKHVSDELHAANDHLLAVFFLQISQELEARHICNFTDGLFDHSFKEHLAQKKVT